jgi:hypothetical protein
MDARGDVRLTCRQDHEVLVDRAQADDGCLDREHVLGRPRVRAVGLAEPNLIVAPAGDHAVGHRHHADEGRGRPRPVRRLQLLARRDLRGRERVGVDQRRNGNFSDEEEPRIARQADLGAVDARRRQQPVGGVGARRRGEGEVPRRRDIADDNRWRAGLALLAERRDPGVDVAARDRRGCTAGRRDAGRNGRARDAQRKVRTASSDARLGVVLRRHLAVRHVEAISVCHWRAHDRGLGVGEFEPVAVRHVVDAGVVDRYPEGVARERIDQRVDVDIGGKRLKSTCLEESILSVRSVLHRQQTFVYRRDLPSKLVELERTQPNPRSYRLPEGGDGTGGGASGTAGAGAAIGRVAVG